MVLFPVAAILSMLWSAPALAASPTLKSDALNPSASCAVCHEQIYAMWQRSMHAISSSDPIFEFSYRQAYFETRGKVGGLCYRCHAPVAALTGDVDLKDPISREGITCDYCHSIVSVNLARSSRPFEIRLDGIKRGPLGDAASPAHGVEKSPLHQSAEFCAGCHEYATPDGLAIFSTYSEWKASPQAAEGKTCQHCHMPLTPGSTVRSDLRVSRREINLHDISGGHSSEQVRRAASAKILKVGREGPELGVVEVEVANIGSGHCIPTGLPTRKLVLEVLLWSDHQLIQRFERTYQRSLLDRQGSPIAEDHRVILEARSLLQDNRLRPGERRVERFAAPVPPKVALRAEMQLRYLYQPQLASRQEISIEIASEQSP